MEADLIEKRLRPTYKAALVLVTSDTCSERPDLDSSGPIVVEKLTELKLFEDVHKSIVSDDQQAIKDCINEAIGRLDPVLIITVGGTGLCPRDVTPEATSSLYQKSCSGIVAALHMYGLKRSPYAALSRLTCGIVGETLIVNFPGTPKACTECSSCLLKFLEHALNSVRFNHEAVKLTHQQINSTTSTITDDISVVTTAPADVIEARHSEEDDSENKQPSSTSDIPLANLAINSPLDQEGGAHTSTQDNQPSNTDSKLVKKLLSCSPYPLIDHSVALDIMGTLSYTLLNERLEIHLSSQQEANKSLGCVLARDLQMIECLPKYDVSTMDGYVVDIPIGYEKIISNCRSIQAKDVGDLESFIEWQQKVPRPGHFFCYQVNTGGRLPEKNYAVVPAEQAGPRTSKGYLLKNVERDKYIRRAGSDLGDSDIMRAGCQIGPVELSIIMAMGHKTIEVFKSPTLGLISTGDELVDFFSPKSTETTDKIVDTNGPLLASFYKTKGFHVISYGIVKDDPQQLLMSLTTGTKQCDILIITGGASMGSRDHVKDVIEKIGGTIHFGRVNIKPGKPAAFSSLMVDNKRKFIFSLPGNPVSAYITNLVLVMPFISHGIRNHLQSDTPLDLYCIGDLVPVKVDKLLDENDSYVFDGRLEFVRAKICKRPQKYGDPYPVTVSFKQQSSRMLSLKDFDCLIIIEPRLKGSKFLLGQTYQALKVKN